MLISPYLAIIQLSVSVMNVFSLKGKNHFFHLHLVLAYIIHFLPGVHVKQGADAHFFIDYENCYQGGKSDGSGNKSIGNTNIEETIREFNSEKITVYPNPSNNKFSIALNTETKTEFGSIKIYALDGQLVFEKVVDLTQEIETQLKEGVYILKILIDEKWYSEKIIISSF